MEALQQHRFAKRYKIVTEEKAGGATYTPKNLADFVARQIIQTARHFPTDRPLRVLDPAVGGLGTIRYKPQRNGDDDYDT